MNVLIYLVKKIVEHGREYITDEIKELLIKASNDAYYQYYSVYRFSSKQHGRHNLWGTKKRIDFICNSIPSMHDGNLSVWHGRDGTNWKRVLEDLEDIQKILEFETMNNIVSYSSEYKPYRTYQTQQGV